MSADQRHRNINILGVVIPISTAVVVVAAVVGFALAMQKMLLDMTGSVDRLDRTISELTRRVDGGWMRRDMETWVQQLREVNEGKLRVPELPR
jgi:hypothetical protein